MMQIFSNAIVSAAGYLLVGLGFSLVYTTGRFFHIAHGAIFTVGAYATYVIRMYAAWPLPAAILGGIMASTLLGVVIEVGIYRPLRKRQATGVTLLLASLGAYMAIQACLTLGFSSGTKTFRLTNPVEGLMILGTRITTVQLATIQIAFVLLILAALAMKHTRIGKKIRAVANDPDLAFAYGINADSIIMTVFVVASAFAGVAAVLVSADSDMSPTMGFRVLLMSMIAVIVGGVGNIYGIALGAIILACLQHMSAWWLSSRWQDAIAFVLLLLFLLLRPQGCFGKPRKKESV